MEEATTIASTQEPSTDPSTPRPAVMCAKNPPRPGQAVENRRVPTLLGFASFVALVAARQGVSDDRQTLPPSQPFALRRLPVRIHGRRQLAIETGHALFARLVDSYLTSACTGEACRLCGRWSRRSGLVTGRNAAPLQPHCTSETPRTTLTSPLWLCWIGQ